MDNDDSDVSSDVELIGDYGHLPTVNFIATDSGAASSDGGEEIIVKFKGAELSKKVLKEKSSPAQPINKQASDGVRPAASSHPVVEQIVGYNR